MNLGNSIKDVSPAEILKYSYRSSGTAGGRHALNGKTWIWFPSFQKKPPAKPGVVAEYKAVSNHWA